MTKIKPKCYGKCDECFFSFVNECIAPPGENYFIKISESQAKLIINNQQRFILSKSNERKLLKKFPEIAV